jgi:hypothetical protein
MPCTAGAAVRIGQLDAAVRAPAASYEGGKVQLGQPTFDARQLREHERVYAGPLGDGAAALDVAQ